MKQIISLITFILCCQYSFSQAVVINYTAGCGTYSLRDLKVLQSELLEAYPGLPIKPVNKFPPYLYYLVQIESKVDQKIYLGIDAGFYSTGGRNDLADYSGEYKLDMPLRSFRFGVHTRFRISEAERFSLHAQLRAGIMQSHLKIVESIIIYNLDEVQTSSVFTGKVIYIEPSMLLKYNIFKSFSVDLTLGFENDFNGKIYSTSQNGGWLIHSNGKPVYLNWSGIRAGLGISWEFNSKLAVN